MPGAFLARAKSRARHIKRDALAVWLAARDPRVPWYVKALCAAIAAYALSPIDLIPDFIPVLGYLDDLILLPLAIMLVVRLLPAELMAEFRATAESRVERPVSRVAAAVIIALWAGAIAVTLLAFWPRRAAV